MAKKIDINGLDHFKEKENAMIASEYSSSKTYAVGDYCYHAGVLQCCTTPITTAENWTAGHWTAAKLADDCSSLKTAITHQIHTEITNLGDGYFNASGDLYAPTSDAQKYTIDYIPVAYGERIVATLNLSAARYRSMRMIGYNANKQFVANLNYINGGNASTIVMDYTIARNDIAFVRYSFSAYNLLSDFSINAYVSNTQILEEANGTKPIIAPVLTEMTADTNLVANDFRIVGDTLYRITTPIASGANLTPNTNCTAVTIAAILKSLLS